MADKQAATRRLVYIGSMDRVDLRQMVGYSLTDESPEAAKFIFHAVTSRADARAGIAQARDGVAMTEAQAIEILTSPSTPPGFLDVTDQAEPVFKGLDRLPPADPSHAVAQAPQAPHTAEEVRAAMRAAQEAGLVLAVEDQQPLVPARTVVNDHVDATPAAPSSEQTPLEPAVPGPAAAGAPDPPQG